MGRPAQALEPQALLQVTLFGVEFVNHLWEVWLPPKRLRTGREWRVSYPVERHLEESGMTEWLSAARTLRPYLRRRDAATWGDYRQVSPSRWEGQIQYQAVRRFLAEVLPIDQRTLRRRFGEHAYWGSDN